jgi:hypothetical protein
MGIDLAEGSWVDKMIAEFQDFTGLNDDHDDQVDAGAHAWNYFTWAIGFEPSLGSEIIGDDRSKWSEFFTIKNSGGGYSEHSDAYDMAIDSTENGALAHGLF